MKTRIKVIEKANGTKYYPQYRKFFIWFHFEKLDITFSYFYVYESLNLSEAKAFIDHELEMRELRKIVRKNARNKKISYIKYP